ncbi:MAG: hypothetical protein MUF00_20125 [Gemmatimonadaceae bacterium]|nr:hypothetical protein [Gemmatimonadaceae bacterium]
MLQTSAEPPGGTRVALPAYTTWFGLVETIAGLNWQLEEQERLTAAINGALRELGIQWARVERITVASPDHHAGTRPLHVQLKLLDEDRVVSRQLLPNATPSSVGAPIAP